MTTYTTSYLAYCASHGRTPEAQIAFDDVEWPGGKMCGYLLWISAEWRAWEALFGRIEIKSDEHHAHFDTWLTARYVTKAA